jgi:SAM-dependent methyltransferase
MTHEPLSHDPAARQDELKRWAEAQALLHPDRGRMSRKKKRMDRLTGVPQVVHGAELVERVMNRLADRLFDRGLDTAGSAHLHEHLRDDRVAYVPAPWHLLPRLLRHVGVSDSDTFVDFGCGKGRVVHQAARRRFRRVIGVEVSPKLAEVARHALAARSRRHRCKNVEIVVADARQFQVPDDLTIAYFFRPFGRATFEPLLRQIVESIDRRPRRVVLIYAWPQDDSFSAIVETERFRLVKEMPTSLLNRHSDRVVIFESC